MICELSGLIISPVATKKSKKDTSKKKPKGAPGTKAPDTIKAEDADEQFDYGGLPDRDLKKNLGCS